MTKKEYAKAYREANRQSLSEYNKRWRQKNKEKRREHKKRYESEHPELLKEQRRRYRQKNKKRLSDYLKCRSDSNRFYLNKIKVFHGCLNPSCPLSGVTLKPCCLDFHHLSDKTFNLGCSTNRSKNKLANELRKCTILCAVCHRLVTYDGLDASTFPVCEVVDLADKDQMSRSARST